MFIPVKMFKTRLKYHYFIHHPLFSWYLFFPNMVWYYHTCTPSRTRFVVPAFRVSASAAILQQTIELL